jgi:glycosyltransferase involved in cell wall biosynthesis
VTVIPDGVDAARMKGDPSGERRAAMRARLGIPPDAPVVVYLGLLAEYQGTSLLIESARLLLQRRPGVYFIVAGYPGADVYKAAARQVGIQDRVLFPGRVPYELVPAFLSAGDIAVAPKVSLTESNGKVLNYMAMGLPVVAFDTPANRAILGDLGHLVPRQDAVHLALALDDAFDDTLAERDALRQRVMRVHSWGDRVHDLERVYARLLGTPVDRPLTAPTSVTSSDQSRPSSRARR